LRLAPSHSRGRPPPGRTIASRYRLHRHSAFQIRRASADIRITGSDESHRKKPKETIMTRSKIALFALAAATLVSANGFANAAPYGDQGSHYVSSGAAAVESGVDQAKGNIR
jgi:hypothetical protein